MEQKASLDTIINNAFEKWYKYRLDNEETKKVAEELFGFGDYGSDLGLILIDNIREIDVNKSVELYQKCKGVLKSEEKKDKKSDFTYLFAQRIIYELLHTNINLNEFNEALFKKDNAFDLITAKKVAIESLAAKEYGIGKTQSSLNSKFVYFIKNLEHLIEPYNINETYRKYYFQDPIKLGNAFKELADVIFTIYKNNSFENITSVYGAIKNIGEFQKEFLKTHENIDIIEFMNKLKTCDLSLSEEEDGYDDNKLKEVLKGCIVQSYSLAKKFYRETQKNRLKSWTRIVDINIKLLKLYIKKIFRRKSLQN